MIDNMPPKKTKPKAEMTVEDAKRIQESCTDQGFKDRATEAAIKNEKKGKKK